MMATFMAVELPKDGFTVLRIAIPNLRRTIHTDLNQVNPPPPKARLNTASAKNGDALSRNVSDSASHSIDPHDSRTPTGGGAVYRATAGSVPRGAPDSRETRSHRRRDEVSESWPKARSAAFQTWRSQTRPPARPSSLEVGAVVFPLSGSNLSLHFGRDCFSLLPWPPRNLNQ